MGSQDWMGENISQAQANVQAEMDQNAKDKEKQFLEDKLKDEMTPEEIANMSQEEKNAKLKEIGKKMGAENKEAGNSRKSYLEKLGGGFYDSIVNIGNFYNDNGAISTENFVVDENGKLHPKTCFVAGTKVKTQSGYKPIETIQTSDIVASANEHTGEISYKRVVQTFIRQTPRIYKLTYNDGTTVETTGDHPFFIQGKGWTNADSLSNGDVSPTWAGMQKSGGVVEKEIVFSGHQDTISDRVSGLVIKESLAVVDIEVIEEETTVYNFEVEDDHTYFVTDAEVWVHNASYVVQRDERVRMVADKFGVSEQDLLDANPKAKARGYFLDGEEINIPQQLDGIGLEDISQGVSRHDVGSEGLKAATQAYFDLKDGKINKTEYDAKIEEIQSGKYRTTFESTTSILSDIGNGILDIGSAIGNGFVNLSSAIGNGIVSIGSTIGSGISYVAQGISNFIFPNTHTTTPQTPEPVEADLALPGGVNPEKRNPNDSLKYSSKKEPENENIISDEDIIRGKFVTGDRNVLIKELQSQGFDIIYDKKTKQVIINPDQSPDKIRIAEALNSAMREWDNGDKKTREIMKSIANKQRYGDFDNTNAIIRTTNGMYIKVSNQEQRALSEANLLANVPGKNYNEACAFASIVLDANAFLNKAMDIREAWKSSVKNGKVRAKDAYVNGFDNLLQHLTGRNDLSYRKSEKPDTNEIIQSLERGLPVKISLPGHYEQIRGYERTPEGVRFLLNDVGYQGDQFVDTYGENAWKPWSYKTKYGVTVRWQSKISGTLTPRKIKGLNYIVKDRYK